MNQEGSRGACPRVDTMWLALPLSARGLVRELANIVNEDGALYAALRDGADARLIGDELARLLCAHRAEHARVRRDAACLLERGLLVVDGDRIRLVEPDLERAAVIESKAKSTSADRMRRLRERQEAARRDALSPSHVTPALVTGDARSDAGDASHVTRSLSHDHEKLSSNREREGARDAGDARRWLSRDAPFCERAREIAACVGIRDPQLVWKAFLARHAERNLSMDWDRLWETWVVREKKWERPEGASRSGPSVKHAVDLDAPWLRASSESS